MTKISCEVRNLGQRFNHFYLFRELSFQISMGEIWMIKGNNGTGKSTLLKILSGGMEPGNGEVLFFGDDKKIDSHLIWKQISMVAPYQELPEELSLNELIDFQILMSSRKIERKEFDRLISLFGMGKDAAKPTEQYSTGMKQKAKIILALGENRPILFLDEPTSNLDPESFDRFWEMVKEMKNEKLVITASNDEKELQNGKLILELGKDTI